MAYASIKIRQREETGVTFVPNEFIDRFMSQAPGEYVKVYLYLLRCLYDREVHFTFSHAARLFDSSEGDIRRALLYWEDRKLLTLETENGMITGISLCSADAFPPSSSENAANEDVSRLSSSAGKHLSLPDCSAADLHAFTSDPEIGQVLFVAEQYLGHHLTCGEKCCFYNWANALSFSADLMIELVDLCISEGLNDITQIHSCALEWHKAGIRSPEEARDYMKRRSSTGEKAAQKALQEKVCAALGITGRSLNDEECMRLCKWSQEWFFSDEMICEACRRTVANTHQASFDYAETILRNWHTAGISDPAGAKEADEAFRSRKAAEAAQHSRKAAGRRIFGSSSGAADTAAAGHSKYGELELLTMANI